MIADPWRSVGWLPRGDSVGVLTIGLLLFDQYHPGAVVHLCHEPRSRLTTAPSLAEFQ